MLKYIKLLNLDLLNSFDLKDLRKAYHKMVLKYHPDKAKDEAQRIEYNNKMKKLNEAYDILEKYLKTHGGRYTNTKQTKTNNRGNTSYKKDYKNNYTSKTYTRKTKYKTYWQQQYENPNFGSEYENAYGEPSLGQELVKTFIFIFVSLIIAVPIYILFDCYNPYKPYSSYKKQKIKNFINFSSNEYTKGTYKIDNPYYHETHKKDISPYKTEVENKNETSKVKSSKIAPEVTQKAEDKYINKLHALVHETWENIILGKSLLKDVTLPINVGVEFTISKNGKIVDKPKITESSGYEKIDKAYIDAIMMNMPYKPFPVEINKDTLLIRISDMYFGR